MHRLACFLLALASVCALAAGAAEKKRELPYADSHERLIKFRKDLKAVCEKFTLKDEKVTRDQAIQSYNTLFAREVRELPAPKDKTMYEMYQGYLTEMLGMIEEFPTDGMRTERQMYMRGCSTTFKHEYKYSTDFNAKRTTQECYDFFIKCLIEARDKMVAKKYSDIRTEVCSALSSLFNEIVSRATIPAADPVDQMDKNIKEARRIFPAHIKSMAELNQTFYTQCETAAKRLQQRATQNR